MNHNCSKIIIFFCLFKTRANTEKEMCKVEHSLGVGMPRGLGALCGSGTMGALQRSWPGVEQPGQPYPWAPLRVPQPRVMEEWGSVPPCVSTTRAAGASPACRRCGSKDLWECKPGFYWHLSQTLLWPACALRMIFLLHLTSVQIKLFSATAGDTPQD